MFSNISSAVLRARSLSIYHPLSNINPQRCANCSAILISTVAGARRGIQTQGSPSSPPPTATADTLPQQTEPTAHALTAHKDHSRDAYIVSVARTPNGRHRGKLTDFSATELGSIAIRAAIERSGIDPRLVNAAIIGNVLSANLGQAPARRAVLGAGLPVSVVCTTVNKVCSSGLKAVSFGMDSIQLGHSDVIVVGGMESMTNVPFYVKKPKEKQSKEEVLKHATLIDGMVYDGLFDPYGNHLMGSIAEKMAREAGITREEQDNHATRSYSSAARAQSLGNFNLELVPIYAKHLAQGSGTATAPNGVLSSAASVSNSNSNDMILASDEEIENFLRVDRLPKLDPAFEEHGTITAGNSSKIADGASALILASGTFVKQHNLKPIARILAHADIEVDPQQYPIASARAIPVALQRARMDIKDVDYYEINEAFSSVSILVNRQLNLNPAHVNIYGGSVALGHPIGSSGSRILTTLTSVLRQTSGSIGVAAICNGGGGGTCLVIERVN